MALETRIFVGIINKLNADESVKVAQSFLQRNKVTTFDKIIPNDKGFFVSFTTYDLAESAANILDDCPLTSAIKQVASVRVVSDTEKDSAVVHRMEREIWIVPKTENNCDDQLEKLAIYWWEKKLCGLGFKRERVEHLISRPTVINSLISGFAPKFTITMDSSEAAVCAALTELEAKYNIDAAGYQIKTSHACSHTHRHDMVSVMLHLPTNWHVNFDDDDFIAWTKPLTDYTRICMDNLRTKVKNPKARQIFLSDEHQRDKFMNNIEKCGRYHGAPVCALLWEHSILYQFRHILRRDQAQRLEFAIQGDPLELSRMRAAVQLITLINGSVPDEEAGRDGFYPDIAKSIIPDILFAVHRTGDSDVPGDAPAERVKYQDLFIYTVGYIQTALKRGETVKKFRDQLFEMVEATGADGGFILNEHLPFHSLGGIVFYMWFRKEVSAKTAIVRVQSGGIGFFDVIQQTYGRDVKTSVAKGSGFEGVFPRGVLEIEKDLKQIAKEATSQTLIS